jgi:hypothetical protein
MAMRSCVRILTVVVLVVLAATVAPATAQGRQRKPKPGAAPGSVNLPYAVNDAAGNSWLIYQGGWLQQRGNVPVYSQSAMLQINGNGIGGQNQARIDEKTGELVFDNLTNGQGVTITRRLAINQQEGYIRYIDIFRNTQPQEQAIQYQLQSNLNFGVTSANNIAEPSGKARPIGWAAGTQGGRAAAELYAGRGAKLIPSLNWQPGNNFCQAQYQLTLPPNKDVAVMHIHATAATPEAGTAAMLALRESKLLAGVDSELRRAIVNFNSSGSFIGEREILRGDVLDVVELRGGDQLKGTIKESSLKLATFYGAIDLTADKVVGLINVGQYRPRQLVVTADGEIFGGQLAKESIELELSSGQVTQVPLSQIARVGWRKRAGESEDTISVAGDDESNRKPYVLLRSGDRIVVVAPDKTIDVNTRYGLLKIQPQSIAAIAFQAEDSGVHQIQLTDGSKFAGLVVGGQFDFKLAGGAGGQTVTFPASAMARLQIATNEDENEDDDRPALNLMHDDVLVGALAGQLKLSTAFDTIALNAPEIRALSRAGKDAGLDVQIELWDQTRMSGQLEEQELTVALESGLTVKVPVPLVEQYAQPRPQPSATMVERIKSLVTELSADDWKQRERAESQLISMGTAVSGVLKEMRPTVGPEAQQRIDSILREVGKARKSSMMAPGAPAGDE